MEHHGWLASRRVVVEFDHRCDLRNTYGRLQYGFDHHPPPIQEAVTTISITVQDEAPNIGWWSVHVHEEHGH